MKPLIRVVGLGPGGPEHVTVETRRLLTEAPVARLRTSVHPAAESLGIVSYDDVYESATSFEDVYATIVADLVALAKEHGEVVYAVPGSPMVAEHTVEQLLACEEVLVHCAPAVSVIDVACARLGVDPMAAGLRIVDALATSEPFRGPGPLLVLQTYAPEVLATVADRLPPSTPVVILHHLGLADENIVETTGAALVQFAADHLTSLWVPGLRTTGEAMDDLVSFTRRLRAECPWDQDQTHESLSPYFVEEAYEAIDALQAMVTMIAAGTEDDQLVAHVEEELGDVLFQVVFHAELADEEGRFTLATIADGVRDKLTQRHPHVFGDATVTSAAEVEQNWEALKKKEKGRTSVLDGIAWQLPALALFQKVARKATTLGIDFVDHANAPFTAELIDLAQRANDANVDLEGQLRSSTMELAEKIREFEATSEKN